MQIMTVSYDGGRVGLQVLMLGLCNSLVNINRRRRPKVPMSFKVPRYNYFFTNGSLDSRAGLFRLDAARFVK